MKILVTGVSGFVGSHLAESLIGRGGCQVIGLTYHDNIENIRHITEHERFQLCSGDIRDLDFLGRLLKEHRPDVIFHLAAFIPPVDEKNYILECFQINTQGTMNLLQAAFGANVKKVIYASTVNVYGKPTVFPVTEEHPVKPTSFYGLTKYFGEHILRLYALNFDFRGIVLRFSGIYGPRRKSGVIYGFIGKALDNEPLIVNISGKPWDAVFVDDVVQANLKALEVINEMRYEVFNIGGGVDLHLKQLAMEIINLTGAQVSPVYRGLKDYPPKYFDIYNLDITKAKRMLNYKPTSLIDCLRNYVEAQKNMVEVK